MLIGLVRVFNEFYFIFIILCKSFVYSLGEPEMLAAISLRSTVSLLGRWPEVSDHYPNFVHKHILDEMMGAVFFKNWDYVFCSTF